MLDHNVAIKLESVRKEYPGVLALSDVSFSVKRGSIHAFLGPNGAGKSTTMKIITGLLAPTSGVVEVNSTIGFLPEHPPLYLGMKVGAYLKFAYELQTLRGKQKNEAYNKSELLELTGLSEVEHRLIGNLSKGYRQRVGIAQALVGRPEIVILDEPTVGLDPKAIAEIRELIVSLKKEHTILLSSHQLHEVEQICSDVTIIQSGKVVSTGTLKEIQKQFQTTQMIGLSLKRWRDEWSERLKGLFGVEVIELRHHDEQVSLKVTSTIEGDQREGILKFLVDHDGGVLGFQEIVPDLEVIFKQLTAEQKELR